jgi:hypothetical protein
MKQKVQRRVPAVLLMLLVLATCGARREQLNRLAVELDADLASARDADRVRP